MYKSIHLAIDFKLIQFLFLRGKKYETSLVVQWLRITRRCGAHRFIPCFLKITHAPEQLSPWAAAAVPTCPGARALQEEKLPQ